MSDLKTALGEGWLGSLLASLVLLVVGGLGGWLARRPLEKAGILEAVNQRMRLYMDHLEAELARITGQHEKCEARLDALEATGARDRELIEQLRGQLAQEKQIASSLKSVKGEQE